MKNSAKYILTCILSLSLFFVTFNSCETLLIAILNGVVTTLGGDPIAGADVILNSNLGDSPLTVKTTKTASDGSYKFEDVEAGTYDIMISKGSFAYTISNVVVGDEGSVTVETARLVPGKPLGYYVDSDSIRADNIQGILRSLGYTEQNGQLDSLIQSDFFDPNKLDDYSIIFINSTNNLNNTSVGTALQSFLNGGGSLYASDKAKNCLSYIPGLVIGDLPVCIGPDSVLSSTITNSGLSNFLGRTTCQINYDSFGWFSIDSTSAVALPNYMNSRYSALCNQIFVLQTRPLTLSENYGMNSGKVIYNTFRNKQQTEDGISILKYLVLEL